MEFLGIGLGLGMIVIGAAFGIGKLGSSATESMARQPEVAGKISTAAIILAALIEGFTFFAIITGGQAADKAVTAVQAKPAMVEAHK